MIQAKVVLRGGAWPEIPAGVIIPVGLLATGVSLNVGFLLVLSSHFTGRLQVRLRCTPNWFASSRRSAVSSRQRGPPRRRRRRRRRKNDPVGAPPPARASGWGGGPRGRALLRYQLTAPDGPLPFATRRGCSQPPARFAKCAEIPSRRKAAGTTSHCDRDRITHSLTSL